MATKVKSLAAVADELYLLQDEISKARKALDVLEKRDSELREYLINELPASDATGVAGKVGRAAVKVDTTYNATDWPAVQGYILKNAKKTPGVWALMQRRLSTGTVKEMASAGVALPPGIEPIKVKKLSLTKV